MELRTVAGLHRVMVVLLMCSSLVAIAYTEGEWNNVKADNSLKGGCSVF